MQQLNIKDAYQYYFKHINRTERFKLLEELISYLLPVASHLLIGSYLVPS